MTIRLWAAGKHRAAGRVRQLTEQQDALLATLAYRHKQLAVANEQTERPLGKVDKLQFENTRLRHEYDELWARHQEATSVAVPAPADLDDTVPIPMPRVIPLSVAFAPNGQAA